MKVLEQQQAIELRKQGQSLNQISKALNVSKSSVSLWVHDIVLNASQKAKLKENQCINSVLRNQWITNKAFFQKKRDQYKQEGYERAKKDESFRLICALYWGEGSKSINSFGFSNCDGSLLNIVFKWLVTEGYDDRIGFYVGYHAENCKSQDEIKQWWKKEISCLKDSHFRKFTIYTINRASQKKMIGKQPHGTVKVQVSCVKLMQRIYGGIDYLKSGYFDNSLIAGV